MDPVQARQLEPFAFEELAKLCFGQPVFYRLVRRRDGTPLIPHIAARRGQDDVTARLEKQAKSADEIAFFGMRHMFDYL